MLFELPDLPIDVQPYQAERLKYFTLKTFNEDLKKYHIKTHSDKALMCLAQDELTQNYEVELYENGNIATREYNWHDYFNLCIWVNFPKTKAVINSLHYSEMLSKTQKNRTPTENAMTLFDENGVVVLSTDKKLLDLIRRHEWKQLFWEHREDVLKKMRVLIIGHSLYEKFLNPYIGMTAHTVLWHIDNINLENNLVDNRLAQELASKIYSSPKSLQPLPILGYPGWYEMNADEAFYDKVNYFRPLR